MVAWGGACPWGWTSRREALAGAGIKTAPDAVAVAQADTVSDGYRKAEEGTEDPETPPAG
jgi:hypothetical protein